MNTVKILVISPYRKRHKNLSKTQKPQKRKKWKPKTPKNWKFWKNEKIAKLLCFYKNWKFWKNEKIGELRVFPKIEIEIFEKMKKLQNCGFFQKFWKKRQNAKPRKISKFANKIKSTQSKDSI